ncbi:MAG: hypothetical protein JXR31_00425 [Prolixibacteraceae bacterium]|nr:hypothetical protein [Prolixibacteraceae bacterium]MBN2772679.1 hypothetical protein [Prolixibacteraceae bacterium]
MKKICMLILALIITFSVSAQTKRGKIFLKNGSIIKGRITQSELPETIHLKSSGNIWVFNMDEIEKIDYTAEKPEPLKNSGSSFSNHTQIGVMIGNSENSQNAPFLLHSTLNYKVDNKTTVGIGTGVEFLKETHLPLYTNIEYRFRDTWFSPYVFLKAGYCFPMEDSRTVYYDVIPDYYYSMSSIWPGYWYTNNELKAKGGVLLNPGFGIVNMFSYNFGMSFSLGYRFTRLHYKGENDYQLDVDFNRLSLTIGILFN